MRIPNTYSEWLVCFDAAKEGTKDAEVLECIKQGSLVLSAGVAGRFVTQLNNVIQFRIKKASDKFSRAMQFTGGDMNMLVNSLLALRKEFSFLIQFVQIPALQPKDIQMLVDAIKKQADQIQESLESTSENTDRTGMLASIIRRNKINNLEDL